MIRNIRRCNIIIYRKNSINDEIVLMSNSSDYSGDGACFDKPHSHGKKMGLSVAEFEYQKSLLEHGLQTATNIQHYLKNYQDPLREPPEVDTKVLKSDYEKALEKIHILETKLERRDDLIVELRRETALKLVGIRSGKADEIRARVQTHTKTDELRVLDLENELGVLNARFQDQCAETNLIKSKLNDEFERFKVKNDEFSKFVFSSQEQYKLILKDKIMADFALEHEKESHALTNNSVMSLKKELLSEKETCNRLKKRVNDLLKQLDIRICTEQREDSSSELKHLQHENHIKDEQLREAAVLVKKYKSKHDNLVSQLDIVVNTMMPIHMAKVDMLKSMDEQHYSDESSDSSDFSDEGDKVKQSKRKRKQKNIKDTKKHMQTPVVGESFIGRRHGALMPKTDNSIHAIVENEIESDDSSSNSCSEEEIEAPPSSVKKVRNTLIKRHHQAKDKKVTTSGKKESVVSVNSSNKNRQSLSNTTINNTNKASPEMLEIIEEAEDSDISCPGSPTPESISFNRVLPLSPTDINKITQMELKLYDMRSEKEALLAQVDALEAQKDEADLKNIELSEMFQDTKTRLEGEITLLMEKLENQVIPPTTTIPTIKDLDTVSSAAEMKEGFGQEEANSNPDLNVCPNSVCETSSINPSVSVSISIGGGRDLISPMSMQPTPQIAARQVPPPGIKEESLDVFEGVGDSISCLTIAIDQDQGSIDTSSDFLPMESELLLGSVSAGLGVDTNANGDVTNQLKYSSLKIGTEAEAEATRKAAATTMHVIPVPVSCKFNDSLMTGDEMSVVDTKDDYVYRQTSVVINTLDQEIQTDIEEIVVPVPIKKTFESVGTATTKVGKRDKSSMTIPTPSFSIDKFLACMSRDYQLLSRKQVPYMDFSKVAPLTLPSSQVKYDKDGRLVPSFGAVKPLINTTANDSKGMSFRTGNGQGRAEDDISKRALNMRRSHIHHSLLQQPTKKQSMDELKRRLKNCLAYIESAASLRNKYILDIPTNADTLQSRNIVRSIDLILQTIGHYLSPYGLHSDDEYPDLLNINENVHGYPVSSELNNQQNSNQNRTFTHDHLIVSGHNTNITTNTATFELTESENQDGYHASPTQPASTSPYLLNNSLTLGERDAFIKNLYTQFDDSDIFVEQDVKNCMHTMPSVSLVMNSDNNDLVDDEEYGFSTDDVYVYTNMYTNTDINTNMNRYDNSSYHHVDFDLNSLSREMEMERSGKNANHMNNAHIEHTGKSYTTEYIGNEYGDGCGDRLLGIGISVQKTQRPVSAPAGVPNTYSSNSIRKNDVCDQEKDSTLFAIRKLVGINDSKQCAIAKGHMDVVDPKTRTAGVREGKEQACISTSSNINNSHFNEKNTTQESIQRRAIHSNTTNNLNNTNVNTNTGTIEDTNRGVLTGGMLQYTYNGENDVSTAMATAGDSLITVCGQSSMDIDGNGMLPTNNQMRIVPTIPTSYPHSRGKGDYGEDGNGNGIGHGHHHVRTGVFDLAVKPHESTSNGAANTRAPHGTNPDIDRDPLVKKATLHETYKFIDHASDPANQVQPNQDQVESAKQIAQSYYSNIQPKFLSAYPHSINSSIDMDTILIGDSLELNKNVDSTAAHTVTTAGAMLVAVDNTPRTKIKPPSCPAPSIVNHNPCLISSPIVPSGGTSRNMISHQKLNSRDTSPTTGSGPGSGSIPAVTTTVTTTRPTNHSPRRPVPITTTPPLPNENHKANINKTPRHTTTTSTPDRNMKNLVNIGNDLGDLLNNRPVSASSVRHTNTRSTGSNSVNVNRYTSNTTHSDRPKTTGDATVLNIVSPQRPKSSASHHNRIPHKRA